MAYTAKAMISVEITIDGVTHVIAEGDKVRNLVYTENGVTREIDEGEVVILGTSVVVGSVPNVTTNGDFSGCVCNPESSFDEYVSVNQMLVDHSSKYDSAVSTIQLDEIVSIGSVVQKDGTEVAGKVYLVQNGDTRYESVADALSAAKAGDTVTMMTDLTPEQVGGSGTNAGMYTIPAGVTFDGNGCTITVDESTATGTEESPAGHVLLVNGGATISNVNIVGSKKAKAGIVAWSTGENPVVLNNVNISNCGTVAVQVSGGKVVANNLVTSGSSWGAVNVDKGSDESIPHFTMNSGDLSAETVEIYTEMVDQDVIEAPGYTRVIGIGTNLKGFAYYTSDMKKLGVMYGVKDGETYVYQTQEDADADLTIPEKWPIE